MAVQLLSNVKIITSGVAPTVEKLLPGQAAFGKITYDGKYHLYGNTGEGGGAGKVVDIIADSFSALQQNPTLEHVLTAGNTTTLDITFDDETGHVTVVGHEGVTVTDGTRVLSMKAGEGFKDGGFAVLSANPDNAIDASAANQMRTFLDVLSKAEVNALVAGVYKIKGTVDNFTTLASNAEYTPVEGDVWNVSAAGGTDMHGQTIKAGDNVVFIGPDKATDWDILSGVVDLSGYYTKTEIDSIKAELEGKITAAQSAADEAKGTANANAGRLSTIEEDYMTAAETETAVNTALTNGNYVADANYVHTDNNYAADDKAKVDTLSTAGDGSKFLADDGSYKELELELTVEEL